LQPGLSEAKSGKDSEERTAAQGYRFAQPGLQVTEIAASWHGENLHLLGKPS
jgi:hypothetical protein